MPRQSREKSGTGIYQMIIGARLCRLLLKGRKNRPPDRSDLKEHAGIPILTYNQLIAKL